MSKAHGRRPRFLWDGFLGEEGDAPRPSRPYLEGERVLITGAGGSLGAAAARALAQAKVAHLCLLDVVEHGLYDLQQHLRATRTGVPYELVLGDVGDAALLDEVAARCQPTTVLHAAALKHVPMLEDNALAAVATNVLGTAAVLGMCRRRGVQRFVLCSTDKAVAPVGVMGATKLLAEQLALTAHGELRVCVLRLCNVLGSTGSVAPLFAAQIAGGQTLTVTDREIARLWISEDEAVRCLLEAFRRDLPTPLAIPQHAEPRRVMDLLAWMLDKAGVPAPEIAFTGLRRGERLTERLQGSGETMQPNGSASLASLEPVMPEAAAVEGTLARLIAAVRARRRNEIHMELQSLITTHREEDR